jgi:hypothetical protein
MREQVSRRRVLATVAGSLSLAGCTQSTAKQGWKNSDEYPDDENRNRKCDIRSSDLESGTIEPSPSSLGYSPYAYTLSGRSDMHGTNQHYELTVTANDAIRIVGVGVENAVNTVADPSNSTLSLPNESDVIEDQTVAEDETYQEMWRIPDGETYTVLFVPDGEMSGPITVEMELGCSYYLPLDEYKERANG